MGSKQRNERLVRAKCSGAISDSKALTSSITADVESTARMALFFIS